MGRGPRASRALFNDDLDNVYAGQHDERQVHAQAAWGQAPLILAASDNRVEAIRVLVEAGVDPNLFSTPVDVHTYRDVSQDSRGHADPRG